MYLNKNTYTNLYMRDYVVSHLLFSDSRLPATHAPDDLFELVKQIKHSKVTSKEAVDMSKNNLKPFNLEAALAGEPVVLRNGLKAYVRHCETELEKAPRLIGFMVREDSVYIAQWTECGDCYWRNDESDYDIIGMWTESLEFEHWDKLYDHIKYIAKDSEGRWFGYSRKPSKVKEGWGIAQRLGAFYSLVGLNPNLFPDCYWENSLLERPKKQRGKCNEAG